MSKSYDDRAIAYTLNGNTRVLAFEQVVRPSETYYRVETLATKGAQLKWKKIAGLWDRCKAISLLETAQ